MCRALSWRVALVACVKRDGDKRAGFFFTIEEDLYFSSFQLLTHLFHLARECGFVQAVVGSFAQDKSLDEPLERFGAQRLKRNFRAFIHCYLLGSVRGGWQVVEGERQYLDSRPRVRQKPKVG